MAAANRRPGLAPRRRSKPRSSGTAGMSMNAEDHQEDRSHPETDAQPLVATVADPTVSGTGWQHRAGADDDG